MQEVLFLQNQKQIEPEWRHKDIDFTPYFSPLRIR